jgi:hypothetical protein
MTKIDNLSAAIEAAKKTNFNELHKLRDQIDGLIKAQGAQAAYDEHRSKRLASALADPDAPATRQAIATLNRLGLTPEQASIARKRPGR